MKKGIIYILVFFAFVCIVNHNHDVTKKVQIGTNRTELIGLSGVSYSFNDITNDARTFLINKSDMSAYYQSGKKFLVYYADSSSSCPIMQAFSQKMQDITSSSNYRLYYNFAPQSNSIGITAATRSELNGFKHFYKTCGQICIVNPVNDKIFSFSGRLGYREIQSLDSILDQLKDW